MVPAVAFTTPSIATVSLGEEQARDRGYEVITSVLPLEAFPRALANRETVGLFKLVADAKSRKLLGAHVVAGTAGEVIYAATLAVKFGLTVEDYGGRPTPRRVGGVGPRFLPAVTRNGGFFPVAFYKIILTYFIIIV